jgi:formate dehydrogenase major subunit
MSDKAKMIHLTIDDKGVEAREGQTVLQVCREQKLARIPSLCYDPLLPPYGSCFLCVVEVEGFGRLLPSCSTPVREGMVVRTDTPKVRDSRKMALELLLSNHYADCRAPCTLACPAGVDVQGYISLISMGKLGEAVSLIRERNPLPLTCGRVCVRYCEVKGCRRVNVDEAVGINNLKRYAADYEMENHPPALPGPDNGHRVAVVGGGPAGLSCAYYLRMKGYGVTIFEQFPKLGGMLRYGIPEYRLPRDVLDREIGFITGDIGVEIRTGSSLGRDFTVESLRKDGYEAVFLALGALGSKSMRVPGEFETRGVETGLKFLMGQDLEGHKKLKGRVVVVGGGNTAVDVARTSLRLGADEVIILYRRTRREMPADPVEIHDAEAEGVRIDLLAAPVEVVRSDDGGLKGLTCIRMELGEPDDSGRRRPVPREGSEYFLPADTVFAAIGQESELKCIGGQCDGVIGTTKWKTIVVNDKTLETAVPGVFAGGDVVSGPDVVIGAIAHGRRAALGIDEFIRTGRVTPGPGEFLSRKDAFGIPEKEWESVRKTDRQAYREMEPGERIKTFDEAVLGLTGEAAGAESARCLECGCQVYLTCELRQLADEYGVNISRFKGEVKRGKIDDRHPFIRIDNNKCILCSRCIRTCGETLGISALGFVNRGFRTEVRPAANKPLQETPCVSCGNCVDVCPTGALITRMPGFKKILPVATEKTRTTCHQCSVGCSMDVEVAAPDLFWVSSHECDGFASEGESANRGYLCVKGRYNIEYMMDPDSLFRPLIREGGKHREAPWNEALKTTRERLSEIASRHGPESVALFGAPYRTNEELYLLQKLGRAVLGTGNVGSFTGLDGGHALDVLEESLGAAASTATLRDLENADVVLLVNSDVDEENFVAGMLSRWAVRKGGTLVAVGSTSRAIDRWVGLRLDARRGTGAALLAGISHCVLAGGKEDGAFIGEKVEGLDAWKSLAASFTPDKVSGQTGVAVDAIERAAGLIANPQARVVALYGIDSRAEISGGDLGCLVNLLLITGKMGGGSGLLLLEGAGNAQGARDVGLTPSWLPGHEAAGDAGALGKMAALWGAGTDLKGARTRAQLLESLRAGRIRGALVFGEDPFINPLYRDALAGVEFLAVADTRMTLTAMDADVVLPLCTMVETEGTVTSGERRVQKVARVFEPRCTMEGWQILGALIREGAATGGGGSVFDVWKEMKKAVPQLSGLDPKAPQDRPFYWSFDGSGENGRELYNGRFRTGSGKARLVKVEHAGPAAAASRAYLVYQQSYRDMKSRLLG